MGCCGNLSEYKCFYNECNIKTQASPDGIGPSNPKGVTVIHPKHPWAKNGKYFYFTKKVWVDEIGAYGKAGKFFVNQWRDAKLIWSGVVIVWDNGNGNVGRQEMSLQRKPMLLY